MSLLRFVRLADGGIKAGTRQVCEKLKAVLEAPRKGPSESRIQQVHRPGLTDATAVSIRFI